MTSGGCLCGEPSSTVSIRELLEDARSRDSFLKISAPMVRYSQLPFRLLARKYGCDVAFSPMIVASSFAASEKARLVDFSTCRADRPLVVQFGATNSEELVSAAGHVVRLCDGIDINCGCPQKWAIKEGLGSALLEKPELVRDMVLRLKNAFPSGQLEHELTISVKIRIFRSERRSVDFVQQVAQSGVDFITIHGRTVSERNDPPHWDIVREINELALRPAQVPLMVNGGLKSLAHAAEIVRLTGARGAMSAENILRNPALFAPENYERTPIGCFTDFISLANAVHNISSDGDKGFGFGRRNLKVKEFNQLRTADESTAWVVRNITNVPNLQADEDNEPGTVP